MQTLLLTPHAASHLPANTWRDFDYADVALLVEALSLALQTQGAPTAVPETLRRAAVLLPIQWHPSGMDIWLTKRQFHLKQHAGQLSFPGGAWDETDTSDIHTALREAHEEVQLSPSQVRVLGALPGRATVSRYWVTPVVGLMTEPLKPLIANAEVAQLVRIPLRYALNLHHWRHVQHRHRGMQHAGRALSWHGHYVWGASAQILFELVTAMLKTRPLC